MDCVVNEYWGDGKNPACPLTEVLDWRYLTASQKEAATALGYSHESWDATSPYSCCYDSPIDELKIVVPDKEGKPIIISLP